MNLFIQIRDGQPYEHPIFEDNFLAAFPGVDPDNLPDTFARFEKTPPPQLGVYDVYMGVKYEWDGDIVREVHVVEVMSDENKAAKQADTKELWAMSPGWTSWVFNEDTCSFEPPFPPPQDGKHYLWEEALLQWKEKDSI